MRAAARRGRGSDDGAEALSRWVDAARSGDSTAFGRLWELLSPRVHGYLRGRGVASPEDVTSDVFLAAFTGMASFTGDGAAFRSWLFTIAHHKAVDDLRRRTPTTEWTPENDPRAVGSAEDTAFEGLLGARVRGMLDVLTPDQREVLLLRTLGDLSIEEVAAVTGRTEGAVKQLFHRAVATARRTETVPPQAPAPVTVFLPLPEPSGSTYSTLPVTRAASTAMTEL
jgi:RNA polymerase sigma-70 factor (ECF subfamily)